jgi:hypothetical protein
VWEETAAAQAGILTRRQAASLQLSISAVRARLTAGRWQRVYPGILATFSGRLPRDARLWAAVLVSGQDAVLSHETAAELAVLGTDPDPSVHVSIPMDRRVVRRPGITVHRSVRVEPHPARQPPQTRIEDTVIDLADAAQSLDSAAGWIIRAVAARTDDRDTPARLREPATARAVAARPRRCSHRRG